jgi:hypothetical protein
MNFLFEFKVNLASGQLGDNATSWPKIEQIAGSFELE